MTHPSSALSAKVFAALLLTVAADFLIFEKPVGISFFIFTGLLIIAVTIVHRRSALRQGVAAKAAIAAATLLPLIENFSGLSLLIAIFGLSAFALSVSGRLHAPAHAAGRIAAFLLAAPFRLLNDIFRMRRAAAATKGSGIRAGRIVVWIVPIVLGGVFLALFGIANPVIEHWLSLIDFWALLELLDIGRILFWIFIAAFAWAFLRPRLPRWLRLSRSASAAVRLALKPEIRTAQARTHTVFGKAAILRALILFNLMFAVQTVLDGAYLWGGVALPEGLTYAAYAHRGAYPLIVTALLAALFVLIAMRPGSESAADRLVRALVYLWTAQNFVLVISSILRLDLYVSVYSLTYLRVAAFIWMGLVAAGLVLITARIALGKSNAWLFSANLMALGAVLYVSSFVNFAAIIAQYNVTHSRKMGGEGISLDVWYLRSLGPAAIPAMDHYLDRPAAPGSAEWDTRRMILAAREYADEAFAARRQEWRAWTFRDWRLARYLDDRREAPGPAGMPPPEQ